MPGSNLSVSGEDFDVTEFLKNSVWLAAAASFRRGDPTGLSSRPFTRHSGFRIDLTPEDASFENQLDAIKKFVHQHLDELHRLKSFPGVSEIEFKIGLFWYEDTVCFPMTLGPDFMESVALARIQTTVYLYATSRD